MDVRLALCLLILSLLMLTAAACTPDESEPMSGTETPGEASATPLGKADSAAEIEGFPEWESVLARCAPPTEDEPVIYQTDFKWDTPHEAMAAKFDEMYASDKRLTDRAYYDAERGLLLLPQSEIWGGPVVLPRRFVESIRRHIETALKLGYAEFIFFPDMGHNHFFIPRERYEAIYAPYDVPEFSEMYAKMIDDPELMVLYHTAEQLRMHEDKVLLTDRQVQWRYYTRNLVGDNNGLGHLVVLHDFSTFANTARSYPGHRYFGSGVNVSASQNACFPYVHNGEVRYFDLSFKDLPMPPGSGGGSDYDYH